MTKLIFKTRNFGKRFHIVTTHLGELVKDVKIA